MKLAMPRRRNPPYILPGDPEYRSDHDVRSSPSGEPHDGMSEASYDEWGQCRGAGGGQGAPLDENGWYIYSQADMPIITTPSPPLLTRSPSIVANVSTLVLHFAFFVCVLTFGDRSPLRVDIWSIA